MPIVNYPLAGHGPVIQLYVHVSGQRFGALEAAKQSIPKPVLVDGLIDTGASCSCIDTTILRRLELSPTGSAQMHTPSTSGSPHTCSQYDVSLWLLDPGPHNIKVTIPIIDSDFAGLGIGMLIGRDILDDCLLVYNGPQKTISLALQ